MAKTKIEWVDNRENIKESLKGRDWTSPTWIGQHAGGQSYYSASAWASPKCKRLVKAGVLERNERGQYRLKAARAELVDKARNLLETLRDFIGTDGVVTPEYSQKRDSLCLRITNLLDGVEHRDLI